jgi:Tol biopolymer transport system component
MADIDGGNQRKFAMRKNPRGFPGQQASWSPDGKLIAASVIDETNGRLTPAIAVYAVADGSLQKLMPSFRNPGSLAWTPDGRGLLMVTNAPPQEVRVQVWYFSYPDGAARKITNDLNDYAEDSLSVTADGSSVVTVLRDIRWRVALAPQASLNEVREITGVQEGPPTSLAWLDSERILLVRDGTTLLSVRTDGSGERELRREETFLLLPAVCGRGRYIVYSTYRDGRLGLWRVDAATGGDPKALAAVDQPETTATCSPADDWVYYVASLEDTRKVFRVNVEGGEPEVVRSEYTAAGRISPDGRLFAFVYQQRQAAGAASIGFLDIASRQVVAEFPIWSRTIRGGAWGPDSRSFDLLDTRAGVGNIWRLGVDGRRRQLTSYPSGRLFFYQWSPDGKHLGMIRGEENHDAVLITESK